jgi:hypothetical protein
MMFYLLLLLKYESVSNKKPAPIKNGAGKFIKLAEIFQQSLKFSNLLIVGEYCESFFISG